MDSIGLASNVAEAVLNIYAGRRGFATRGKEQEGRISYEIGIDMASEAFKEAQNSSDPQALALAEYAFISQELELCPKTDKYSLQSLTSARQSFDDAFLVLQVVEDSVIYKGVDKAFPHHKDYRFKEFPKDAFHIACMAHKARLQNILRSPGIDSIEKFLLEQRLANLSTAQSGYLAKQEKALMDDIP